MENFKELSLSAPIARAIEELGFTTPSAIQAQALPILLGEATDFIGLAATGTGKTAAFTIPLLQKLDPKIRKPQALILCPTRELANQVAGQVTLLGKYMGVRALPIYGGAGYGDQIKGIKSGAQVIVGTPGRVIDHLEKGTLSLAHLTTLILDEADEMISMGFKEAIEEILSQAPREQCPIWLFSATMSREVRKVADQYLENPQMVEVNRTEMVPVAIEQLYYLTSESNKPEVLCKLIEAADDFYGLIFCQTKQLVADLTQYLRQRGYPVDCLHGDMEQAARERMMLSFRNREVTILVCTDVASRGLDVKDVTHVINYSLPRELDNYVHRIGRTARSGKTGFAMSLVTPSHRNLIRRIEQMTKSRMNEGKIPTRREIGMKKITKALGLFEAQTDFKRSVELLSPEWKTAIAEMSGEEIVGRFLALTFPEIFSASSKDEPRERQSERGHREERRDEPRHEPRNYPPRGERRPEQRTERKSGPASIVRGGKPAKSVGTPTARTPVIAGPVIAVSTPKIAVPPAAQPRMIDRPKSIPAVIAKAAKKQHQVEAPAATPMIRLKPEWPGGEKKDKKNRWRDRETPPKRSIVMGGDRPLRKQ